MHSTSLTFSLSHFFYSSHFYYLFFAFSRPISLNLRFTTILLIPHTQIHSSRDLYSLFQVEFQFVPDHDAINTYT